MHEIRTPTLVREFLGQRRIAVAGVSRQSDQAANAIFRKLRDAGYQVVPVNPAAREAEGVPCYPDLTSIPGGVDAVMVVTPAAAAAGLVEECAKLGIRRAWLHRAIGPGSVSKEAVRVGRERGVEVIAGACPMMFVEPVDFGHKCLRWWVRRKGMLGPVAF